MKLFILCLCLLLAGCDTFPRKERVVVKTVTVVADIPAIFLTDCEETPPPPKAIYNSSSMQDKESLLTDFSLELSNDLRECGGKIINIRKRLAEQKARFEKKE